MPFAHMLGVELYTRMIHGALPVKRLPKKQLHQHLGIFGAALPTEDFCVDRDIWWPNQNDDNAPTECVGYTAADIMCDLFGLSFSPDWIYKNALVLSNTPPTTAGADPHKGLQSLVAFGGLLQMMAPISASLQGELMCANPANWPAYCSIASLQRVENGTANVLGNGDAFTSILTAASSVNRGISVATPWVPEFETPNADGTVNTPDFTDIVFDDGHNWVAKGMKTINGVPHVMVKSHQGKNFGDKGWLYFNRETVNGLLAIEGTAALSLLTTGARWVASVGILCEEFPALLPYLPQLIQA